MSSPSLNLEIVWMLLLLLATVYLFVFSRLRVDVSALSILTALWLGSYLPGASEALSHKDVFIGFSSSAVISILAVMVIGAGLDKTGVMNTVAARISDIAGKSEQKTQLLLSSSAAFVSAFMQNIGVAALFLPVTSRVARRSSIPMSRLLMPMGFCTILGGTATMIGGSPLIMLNDLLLASNQNLPADQQLQPLSLFAPLPIGIALTLAGLLYFSLAGRFLLPTRQVDTGTSSRTEDYFEQVYGVTGDFFEARLSRDSPLVGSSLHNAEETYASMPFVLALYSGDVVKLPPDREEIVWANTHLGLLGERDEIELFCSEYGLELLESQERFNEVLNAQHGGIAEIVIPPRSALIGRAVGDIKPRRNFGTNILRIQRSERVLGRGFRDVLLRAGDTLVVYASWKDLHKLRSNPDVIVVTDFQYEEQRTHKIRPALGWFVASLALFLFSQNLPLSLIAGAIGMVLSGVINMDEAYAAINWQTFFLLAGLIPLGVAVEKTGTALWIANSLVGLIGNVPDWVMQTVVAGLAMLFSQIMSNVGATTLVVPLAINIAISTGADPATYALIAVISTSNAFLIPTNQVNALIMGPGGYKVSDFMVVGAGMSVLFLIVSLLAINFLVAL